MDKVDFKKMWQIFLIQNGLTNQQVANEFGLTPQSLGRKINQGTIKAVELASILEKYGYTMKFVKVGE